MRLVSADRRDLEALLGRMDVRAMVPSGCDGGAEWPPEPSGRDRCGLLMLLALIALVSLVLSAWKLRVKRLSSLAKREAASLKGYCEMRGPLNKCSLEFERQMIAKGEIGGSDLGLLLPSEPVLDVRRDKISSEGRRESRRQIR